MCHDNVKKKSNYNNLARLPIPVRDFVLFLNVLLYIYYIV